MKLLSHKVSFVASFKTECNVRYMITALKYGVNVEMYLNLTTFYMLITRKTFINNIVTITLSLLVTPNEPFCIDSQSL